MTLLGIKNGTRISPYSSNLYGNSDEIRIPVHQQVVYTSPTKGFSLIDGKIVKDDETKDNCIYF